MIDLEALKKVVREESTRPVQVTRPWLAQVVAELEAGRQAQEELARRTSDPVTSVAEHLFRMRAGR